MVERIIIEHEELFKKYNYPKKIVTLQEKLKKGEFTAVSNIITGEIKAPTEKNIPKLPDEGSEEYNNIKHIGVEAIKNNEVGVIILNGGMATRFGGVVKGVVEVYEGKSFLELKIRNVKHIADKHNAKVPVFIMNSFQTELPTERFLKENNHFNYPNIHCFNQLISVRLQESGEIFLDADGKPSFYGPGHGDFKYAFVNSGMLEKFIGNGGKYILFSNCDNLGATLDPAIIGLHIQNGNEMTVEVAPKYPGDKGGAPAFVDDNLQIVEQFKFPKEFNQDSIPVFNTNTFVFSAEALEKEIELDWYIAIKEVDGNKVVQFERLAGEMSIHLMTGFVEVPREDTKSRFIPIKVKDDLSNAREQIKKIMEIRNNE